MSAGSPYLKTSYSDVNAILPRTYQKVLVTAALLLLLLAPVFASNFHVHLMNLAALATIGALALNLLTGFCGQISLGHAGFLAAGAFTTAILVVHLAAPFWSVVPVAGLAGALLGLLVGLPSLRFRGLYLAISTLAMHYAVGYAVKSYQANIGASATAGVSIPDPVLGPLVLADDRAWYYFLLVMAGLVTVVCLNLLRTRLGRAWIAIRDRDIAAEALGIHIARYKLLAFVVSSTLTAMAGSLTAYYSNVVSADEFTLELAVTYLAMIIVGGMGSVLGSIFGAYFITLLPFAVDALFDMLPVAWRQGVQLVGFQSGAVGVFIILFLLLEPKGLAELWWRVETYFERWPFKYRPLEPARR